MGRKKFKNYIIEWWLGDHLPKHVHIFKDGEFIAKIEIPSLIILEERRRIPKNILNQILKLYKEGVI